LCNDYTGQTEIGSLILAKHYRQGYNGKLLSYSRFLFMAEFPQRFAEKVFAEMRGVCDDKGHSPFWHGLGRHFFQMEFPMADYLSGADSKSFIAQLMPTHPIYVPLLSEDAQRVIAQPHPQTRSALALLKRQGFEFSNYIDIFDGGPTVDSPLQKIKMVRHSKPLQIVDCVSNLSVGAELPALLANTQLADFRCCVADYQICGEEGIAISAMVAQQLGVHKGDWVRGVPFAVTEQQADSSKPG
jgi:arginine N-succinyltransferase